MPTSELPLFLQHLLQTPSFPLHEGTATIESIGRHDHPFSQLIRGLRKTTGNPDPEGPSGPLPALVFSTVTGQCFVAVKGQLSLFSQDFGKDLHVQGTFNGRDYTFHAPVFYCRREPGWRTGEEWVLFEPLNEPATLCYDTKAQIVEVTAHQLNFSVLKHSDLGRPLNVKADGREVAFSPTSSCSEVLQLLRAGFHKSAPLTEITFSAWEGATESGMEEFAWSVSRCCGLIAQQQTNLAHLAFRGEDKKLSKVRFYQPMRSKFRDRYLLPSLYFDRSGLGHFFEECYGTFVSLSAASDWQRLFNLAMTFDDGIYLETRLGDLLAGFELLFRNSLIDAGVKTRSECDRMMLPALIGAARNLLGWPIPGHYTQFERYREIRNAAAHAGDLPCTPREGIDLHQKWANFLFRRILLRLGYTGEVTSATKGYSTSSNVADFSEEANSFEHNT